MITRQQTERIIEAVIGRCTIELSDDESNEVKEVDIEMPPTDVIDTIQRDVQDRTSSSTMHTATHMIV